MDGFSRRETHAKLGLGPISDKQHTGGEKNGSGGYIYGEGRMSWGPGRTGMSRNRHVDTGRWKSLWKAVSRVACNALCNVCNVVVRVIFVFFQSMDNLHLRRLVLSPLGSLPFICALARCARSEGSDFRRHRDPGVFRLNPDASLAPRAALSSTSHRNCIHHLSNG